MAVPSRLDQAIAPAGLVRSAAAYSLFIDDDGIYAIATGPGWRFSVRGRYRNELLVEHVRRVEAELDSGDLARELAERAGSIFVAWAGLEGVAVSKRFDHSPRLRFADERRAYRFDFDEGRLDDVEAFAATMTTVAHSPDPGDERSVLVVDGTAIATVALPSPCWGATPHVSVEDGRLFVEYVGPTGRLHGEMAIVHRSTDDEQERFRSGRLDVSKLCRHLVGEVWGTEPPST